MEVNALSMRPISGWARDIPVEAFERGKIVVTAPSAMDLYCMGRMRPQLDKRLKEWEQKQKVGIWGDCVGQTGCVCIGRKAGLDVSPPRLSWHGLGRCLHYVQGSGSKRRKPS